MALYSVLAASQKLTAAGLNLLIPNIIVKGSDTSRNTTISSTADPDLQGMTLAVGTHEVHMLILASCAASGVNIRTGWVLSGGTWNVPIRACTGPGQAATGGTTDNTTFQADGNAANVSAFYALAATSAYSVIHEDCFTVDVSVSGTLAFYWAQMVSNGTDVTVHAGSSMWARQIG